MTDPTTSITLTLRQGRDQNSSTCQNRRCAELVRPFCCACKRAWIASCAQSQRFRHFHIHRTAYCT